MTYAIKLKTLYNELDIESRLHIGPSRNFEIYLELNDQLSKSTKILKLEELSKNF